METALRLVRAETIPRGVLASAAAEVADPDERRDLIMADDLELASDTAFTAARERWRRDAEPQRADRPPGRVPATQFFLLGAGDALVAQVAVRHRLTDDLRALGGHIGYAVAPSWRGRGCGTQALARALPVAAELGLTTVLVTCHHENHPSRRIIERNGGVLVDHHGDRLRFVVATAGGSPDTDISRLR